MRYELMCFVGILTATMYQGTESPATCETDQECIELCSYQEGRQCTDEDLFGPSSQEVEQGDIGEECHPDDSTCWNEKMGIYR